MLKISNSNWKLKNSQHFFPLVAQILLRHKPIWASDTKTLHFFSFLEDSSWRLTVAPVSAVDVVKQTSTRRHQTVFTKTSQIYETTKCSSSFET